MGTPAPDIEVVAASPACRFDAPRPILFVHGMWHAAWCWNEHFLRFFDDHGYAAHALNLRGHGGRAAFPRTLRWTSLADYSQDLQHAASLFQQTPILIGHSLGCLLIEICLARVRPPAAILLAPTRHGIFRTSTLGFIQRHPWRSMELILRGTMRPVVANTQLGHEMLFSRSHPIDDVRRHCARLGEESFRVATELLFGIGPKPTTSPTTRILVLGGTEDRAVSEASVHSVAQAHGTRAEFFAGMGHDMMLETGWERVAQRIVDWLANHSPTAPPQPPAASSARGTNAPA